MTISNADLDSAVAAGLIDAPTAAALRAHAARRSVAAVEGGEQERFRLLSGFNDVFVVVALSVLLASLAFLAGTVLPTWAAHLLVAGAAWLLSLYFVQRRRLALPGVALALGFALPLVALAVALSLNGLPDEGGRRLWLEAFSLPWPGLALAGAAALHGWRFRVPVNAGLMAFGLGMAVVSFFKPGDGGASLWLALGLSGLLAAVLLDATDRLRQTLRADAAFWLHLVAAPFLVAGVFGLMAGLAPLPAALLSVLAYLLLVLLALVLDRRAPLVSGLACVLTALAGLFRGDSVGQPLALAGAALVVASALLLLAAGWQRARAPLLRRLPLNWQQRLPPA